jgi:hypothetical protein
VFAGDLASSENRINIGKSALPTPNAREDFDFAVPSFRWRAVRSPFADVGPGTKKAQT